MLCYAEAHSRHKGELFGACKRMQVGSVSARVDKGSLVEAEEEDWQRESEDTKKE